VEVKRAYVAGPYRAPTREGIDQNIAEAREIAVALWQMGYSVFCPHLNTAHFDGLCPDEVWLEGDLEWVRVSQLLVMHPRWGESRGAIAEHTEACRCLIPVFHWPEDAESLRVLA
jgi:hypothetical protein